MSSTVCAVVVTYNRKDLLRECLCALANQTHSLDAILVVDNCSTDGTDVMLAAEFKDLSSLRLQLNSGGAGGFHEGIKWAFERHFTWIWVMDDDVEAMPDALAMLLEFQSLGQFIHPRRMGSDGQPYAWEGLFDPSGVSKKSFGSDVSFEAGRDWIPVNYGCFEGALIHRSVVAQVGLPDKRFFFQGDDEIYGFHAARCVNVIYVNRLCLRRKLPTPAKFSKQRLYIVFRNRFLTREHLEKSGLPTSRVVFWVYHLFLMSWYLRATKPRRALNYWHGFCGMLIGTWHGSIGRFGAPPWIR